MEDKDELPPVYVITLAEEPWKGLACQRHLKERDIKATFLQGFHGVALGLRAIMPVALEPNGTPQYSHPSQLGLALSYLHALRVAVLTCKDEFILCEDDVEFPEKFEQLFWESRTWWPKSVDVVQLYYGGHEDKPTEKVNEGFYRCCYPFGTTCVWWSVKGATQAIQMLRPVHEPIDIALITKVYPFLNHGVTAVPLVKEKTNGGGWPKSMVPDAGQYDQRCVHDE